MGMTSARSTLLSLLVLCTRFGVGWVRCCAASVCAVSSLYVLVVHVLPEVFRVRLKVEESLPEVSGFCLRTNGHNARPENMREGGRFQSRKSVCTLHIQGVLAWSCFSNIEAYATQIVRSKAARDSDEYVLHRQLDMPSRLSPPFCVESSLHDKQGFL
ncbi:hypothetical protein BDY19DRAFT_773955 [Irpex rosettiformis]|uniref:Uncharacterized protein n=1 Tax=Irpex rosettiformis TaxID=378272 RepID=A0ACB8U8A8_9APHY|nr:hypothetical protein BDY19DRAFT_773955 [Irpex rosettiformis]